MARHQRRAWRDAFARRQSRGKQLSLWLQGKQICELKLGTLTNEAGTKTGEELAEEACEVMKTLAMEVSSSQIDLDARFERRNALMLEHDLWHKKRAGANKGGSAPLQAERVVVVVVAALKI